MPSGDEYCGLRVAVEKSEKAEDSWGGDDGGSCWRMSATRGSDPETELMQAAEACRVAFRRPTPPKETGRDAFAEDQGDRGPPTMSSRLLRMSKSKDWVASLIKVGGQVRREKEILGKPRQALSSVVSSCESWRSGKKERA